MHICVYLNSLLLVLLLLRPRPSHPSHRATDVKSHRWRNTMHKIRTHSQVLVDHCHSCARCNLVPERRIMRREHFLRNRNCECYRNLAVGRPLAWLKNDYVRWSGIVGNGAVGVRDADIGDGCLQGDFELLDAYLVAEELPCGFGITRTQKVASLQD